MDPQSAADAVTATSAVTGPWGLGGALVLFMTGGFTIWRKFQRERVDTASDRGQVSYMRMIVADRDAALLRVAEQTKRADDQMMRADDYAKRFYESAGKMAGLKGQLENLAAQVKTQSDEIARLRVQLESRT